MVRGQAHQIHGAGVPGQDGIHAVDGRTLPGHERRPHGAAADGRRRADLAPAAVIAQGFQRGQLALVHQLLDERRLGRVDPDGEDARSREAH